MRKRAPLPLAGLLAVVALLTAAGSGRADDFAEIERGRYLTQAGNCQGCHTPPGEEAFAGSRALETPFGVIYTPNITFDTETGLGRWSRDDFWRAMHEGKAKDGSQLYPAFPYPHFTKMPREDVDAIYAYLATLDPVRKKKPPNELPFPLGWRFTVKGWNMAFFEPGVFRPDPAKPEAWNRGAYLVEGPGHCSGCHTEKNLLGADRKARHLAGGRLENWSAPDIRGGRHGGLERWSEAEIVEFLRTERNAHSAAFSIMSEVISYSTQHMAEADLKAIATYLKDLDGEERAAPARPDEAVMTAGAAIYSDNCTACHGSDGSGVPRFFPPLAGSGKVNNPDATTVIRALLEGARAVPTKTHPSPLTMPAFGWKLDDGEIAAVATYVRSSWGNAGGAVEADAVRELRGLLAGGPP